MLKTERNILNRIFASKIFVFVLLFFGILSASYSDEEVDAKVAALLKQMTLEEKIGQLNQYSNSWDLTGPKPQDNRNEKRYDDIANGRVGSMLNVNYVKNNRAAQKIAVENSRLGIPLIFGVDVIHGYKTMFPIPLALASSWDMEIIEKAERVAATEAAAAGIHWTFNPMVDVARDPRWGRVMEGGGEDPYLNSQIGIAKVKGYQGDDLSATNTIAACAKHFAAYGAAIAGREYNSVEVSNSTLYNIYLPPFKACADAGAATFMNAFHTLNGVPCTGNQMLVNDILKGKWNWDGFVISDWGSIGEMVDHGTAENLKECALKGISGKTDMDMESHAYMIHLKELVEEGQVDEELINDSVRRILKVKYQLGLFDDPYKYCDDERQEREILSEEHLQASFEAAQKSIVLLKNENNILPLDKDIKSIAVIGPLAKDDDAALGSWRCQGNGEKAVTVYDAIAKTVSTKTKLYYTEGTKIVDENAGTRRRNQEIKYDISGINEAVKIAKKAEMIIAVVGETAFMSGEAKSRMDINLPGAQKELLIALKKLGKPIVVVLMNGRPLTIPWTAENCEAIIETWFGGNRAGDAIASVLFGDYNPAGKLPMTFPRHVGQIPIFYNELNTGRPILDNPRTFCSKYIDGPNTPLFPFGWGLSYSNFVYSNMKLDKTEMKVDGEITVSIEVKNDSEVDGYEVVQLYIRDFVASISRPIKELKDFQKVLIKAGETKTISFSLTKEDLSYFDNDYNELCEPGNFEVMVGGNSIDLQIMKFEIIE